ncbi:amidohydrolase family protein [Halobacillus salinarum]|uniref:amidohydrolase family protein n=1 Tax=Halobacillus salinarum TaxID=2932257 RepID=UPI0029621A72|nr:amidohydrolase family protein [Halobacillus salinarum]
MEELDLIIKNGDLVTGHGIDKQDVGIKDGKIATIHKNLSQKAKEIYDAEGTYIFPGMIDVHVHFNEPGREDWEGFSSGSYMMAAGGATTYFDMPLNGIPSTTTPEALNEKAAIGQQKSLIDFGLWGGLVPGNEHHLQKLSLLGS